MQLRGKVAAAILVSFSEKGDIMIRCETPSLRVKAIAGYIFLVSIAPCFHVPTSIRRKVAKPGMSSIESTS